MGKILGSWSGMRRYLEDEMLAESLRGRVRYGCTAYTGMDGCRIFEICIDGKQIKRFSWETVNSYFIGQGFTDKTANRYWADFWALLDEYPPEKRTEYTDDEFCSALEEYRNQDIRTSLRSPDPLVRMFAVLDRRVGKRTLETLRESIPDQPEWLQYFYRLRTEA